MKKLLSFLLCGFLLTTSHLNAQNNSDEDYMGSNEVRLNVLGLVLPGLLDLSYERFLDNSQSIGIQASVLFPNGDVYYDYLFNYSIAANYRLYTSSSESNNGFFVQFGLNFASVPAEYLDYYYDPILGYEIYTIREENEFYFGPEVGLGGKWFGDRNWC